jgi:NAD(P)-dependent dehydrogenase (short-subunit alcohol dehydrogenase family)
MPGRLGNKVALITGGASGFGAAIAAKFVLEGAKVVITDLSIENGEKVSNELGCLFVQADVTKRRDWEEVLKEVLRVHGGLDIVVNNAGASYASKVCQWLP